MAATEQGVWDLQNVRDKQLQSEWSYDGQSQGFVWGWNNTGNLGLNDTVQRSSPTQVGAVVRWWPFGDNVFQSKTYDSGTGGYDLWAYGNNSSGKLGLNDKSSWPSYQNTRSSPTQLPGTDWKWVGGFNAGTTYAIKTDGSLWSWGANTYGLNGLNNQESPGRRSSPTQIGTDTTWQGSLGKIAGGSSNTAAIKTDGTLWIWGRNYFGSLGLSQGSPWNVGKSSPHQLPGTNWERISETHGHHLYFTKTDGTLWTMGYGQSGYNLQPDKTSYSSPKQIPGDWSNIMIVGNSESYHTVKTDGTLWGWGGGPMGTLGKNNTTQYSSPVQIGTDTNWGPTSSTPANMPGTAQYIWSGGNEVLAIKTDGTLWTWGRNHYGQLGKNNITWLSSPTQVGSSTDWVSVYAGQAISNALKTL